MKKMRILAAAAAALACLWSCEDPIVDDIIAEVSVSPASITFEAEGGTLKVAVTANVDFEVTGSPEWLKIEKNGKELSVTAEANTVNQPRNGEVTLTAGTASAKLAVSQKAGSPYSGFTVAAEAVFEYAGTMLYQFAKPSEEDYGGQGYIDLADEEGNALSLWVYTELFESEEEVELSTGRYVKGEDDFSDGLKLCGKKYTFVAGAVSEDEDEDFIMGSYYTSAAEEKTYPIVDGVVEVTADNNGVYTIKADMVGADGVSYRYVYEGQIEINADGATYPGESDHIDVAATIYGAAAIYYGDAIGNGTTTLQLQLYSGDPQNPAMTQFTFITESMEYSEDFDLSGTWATPDDEADAYNPGALLNGALVEMTPGFEMPQGTYVMYTWGDYLIGDGYNSLTLTRQDDGKYTLFGAITSSEGEYVMFAGADFSGIHDLEIPFIDGTQSGEEED